MRAPRDPGQEFWDAIRSALKAQRSGPPLRRVLRQDPLPLSFGQQRLWVLSQLEPQASVYNLPATYRLEGRPDPAILERCLVELVRRHEVLRTTFPQQDGEPRQEIGPAPSSFPLDVVDLTGARAEDREAHVQRVAEDQARPAFSLSQGPLLRGSLIRLAEEEHLLHLTVHHAVFDTWSEALLLRELATLYAALSASLPASLPELPIQYADYAVWQREWLRGELLESQLSYWKEELRGLAMLELPGDRPRPAMPSHRGGRCRIAIPKDEIDALKALGRSQGATLFMTLLSVFIALIHRYTGQEDFAVGTPVANRNRREMQGVMGFFANTLVLRARPSGNPTFLELLEATRKQALAAFAHQDVPFEKVVDALGPQRELSHNPLFLVMFVLQTVPVPPRVAAGLGISSVGVHAGSAMFDLTLELQEKAQGVEGWFDYSSDLFDAQTIARMARHFLCLVRSVLADPGQRLSELRLLTPQEEQQVLVDWNRTAAPPGPAGSVIDLLYEDPSRWDSDSPAVVFEDEVLSFRALNHRANDLASRLQSFGVGPDSLVGICLHRSTELAVAVLAAFKAGGACLPLDPAYPRERLSLMLGEAQPEVVLTTGELREALPEGPWHVLCLDSGEDAPAGSLPLPVSRAAADHLAYVLYTSGSTGRPKGVAMNQRCLANLIAWQATSTPLPAGARTLQFASLCFDVSFQEIFSTWLTGGTLVLVGEELRRDPSRLLELLEERAVDRVFLPFVALQQLAEVAARRPALAWRPAVIVTSGEQLQVTSEIRRLFERLEGCALHNQYGPSETHVATSFALNGSPQTWPGLPSIGRPIASARVYLLDRHGRPVPVGVPGEIHLGGECLARGYLDQPGLSAERFLPDPFGNGPAGRMYRTGDLGRYLDGGDLEFLGRTDDQIKVRGFRIETGEVEAALRSYPAVREAAVAAWDYGPGDRRLVAWVVPAEGTGGAGLERDLRLSLQERLPGYMVPSAIVTLDRLPLTPSGKLDRRRLPAPGGAPRDTHGSEDEPPGDLLERQLAAIWEEVLQVRPIGRNQGFFDLGGESLLAVRLMERVRRKLGRDLPLSILFRANTVARLAGEIRRAGPLPWSPLAPLQERGSQPALFLVHPFFGVCFPYVSLARRLGSERPVIGIQAAGLEGEQPLDTDLRVMAERYVKAVRDYQRHGPYHLGGHSMGGLLAYEMACQLTRAGEEVGLVAVIDTDADLDGGILSTLRTLLFTFRHMGDFAPDLRNYLFLLVASGRLSAGLFARAVDRLRSRFLDRAEVAGALGDVPQLSSFSIGSLARLRDIVRAQARAIDGYSPAPYDGKVTLFATEGRADLDMGWARLAPGGLEVWNVPGNHFTLMREPNCRVLAERIQECLARNSRA